MRFACWVTKATNTHVEHETIIAFLLQQRCHEVRQCYVVRTLPNLPYLNKGCFVSIKKHEVAYRRCRFYVYWHIGGALIVLIFIKFHIKKLQANKL